MVAKIAVAAAVYAIDKPYSYRIPQNLTVQPGMRVMVPFGHGNRHTEGIVLSVEAEQGVEAGQDTKLKCISQCLDKGPVLEEAALRLAAFVRERYFCTFYEAIKAMLPAGLWFHAVDRFSIAEAGAWRGQIKRQPLAEAVMEQLESMGGQADYTWLRRQFQEEDALQSALRYLLGKKMITNESDFFRRVGDQTVRMASLTVPAEEAMEYAEKRRRSAPMQCEALKLLCTVGKVSTKELCYFTGCTMATLNRLKKLGYLDFSEEPAFRRVEVRAAGPAEPIVLTDDQNQAYGGLCKQMSKNPPGAALLYGVTGSGKTAVYLKLIEHCLELGGTAMLLVPEIGLTPQLLGLFAAHFGDKVAVLHSGLRVGERYDEWKRIRSGEARIVIGTRSAVFAPAKQLRLIIVDEEQEHTYQSENAPRYHAREVALFRGVREQALVILGSATPSIETMYHAKKGDYRLYTLPYRFNGRELPDVSIVDMKQELKQGNSTSISSFLQDALADTIRAGKQAILFLNRRGASRCLVCVDCGSVPQCPRCSVNLTYHAANRRLMCHYCGYSEPLPVACPVCGGHLKQVGTGTQRVVEELGRLFPSAQVLRMDADTVGAAGSHEKLLAQFEQEKIPILVGTQMVTKGLNFENVTLVGVLDADMALYVDHFRAPETAFSMITQVIGRSGRGKASGTAVIQTMTPENAVIRLAAAQDYDRFYEMEVGLRRLRGCPPFRDMLVLTFTGVFEDRVLSGARLFRDQLGQSLRLAQYQQMQALVLGPAPAPVVKVNNRYRYRLTLSCNNSRPMRQLLSHLLCMFAKDGRNKGVGVFVDVNPYH